MERRYLTDSRLNLQTKDPRDVLRVWTAVFAFHVVIVSILPGFPFSFVFHAALFSSLFLQLLALITSFCNEPHKDHCIISCFRFRKFSLFFVVVVVVVAAAGSVDLPGNFALWDVG